MLLFGNVTMLVFFKDLIDGVDILYIIIDNNFY